MMKTGAKSTGRNRGIDSFDLEQQLADDHSGREFTLLATTRWVVSGKFLPNNNTQASEKRVIFRDEIFFIF